MQDDVQRRSDWGEFGGHRSTSSTDSTSSPTLSLLGDPIRHRFQSLIRRIAEVNGYGSTRTECRSLNPVVRGQVFVSEHLVVPDFPRPVTNVMVGLKHTALITLPSRRIEHEQRGSTVEDVP